MKKIIFLMVVSLYFASFGAYARDDVSNYSIKDALNTADAKAKLGSDVKFYFGGQPHGKVSKSYGEVKTNKKTNAFNKSDEKACQWTFLSAMIALRDRALRDGGNAVINIKSNYRNKESSNNETFQCGSGALMAGVALMGTVVKTEK